VSDTGITRWECPHCSAQQSSKHPQGWEHILATCDIDLGGCGRTVIIDVKKAAAYRAIKSFDPICAPLVDVDREYVYPPGSERICAADERHDDHERRLVACERALLHMTDMLDALLEKEAAG